MAGRPWTPDDDTILKRRLANGVPYSAIAKELGRNLHSCSNRARRMGLRANANPTAQATEIRRATLRERRTTLAETEADILTLSQQALHRRLADGCQITAADLRDLAQARRNSAAIIASLDTNPSHDTGRAAATSVLDAIRTIRGHST